MKIRNGFVSNSSSSSFVIAFPKKPKTSADVWKYMFSGKDGGLSVYNYDGLSYCQISSIVFNDLQCANFKKATLNNIADEFFNRYHYYPTGNNVFWSGKVVDEHGGSWSEKCGRYCGNNKKLMEQLRLTIIESEEKDRELRKKEESILAKSGLKQPKYAYKSGIDPYTNKPYTSKDIKATEDYNDAIEKFRNTNEEYLAFRKEERENWDNKHSKISELSQKIALEDAQNFLDDNKGKFVFMISYSDNDGNTGCTMEHGDIFRNVPHVRISNH